MGRFFQAPTSSDPYSVSKVAFLSSRPRSRSVALSLLFALLPLLAPQAALGQEDEHDEIARGLTAGTWQHECDHLDGVLFVDRVRDPTTMSTWAEFEAFHRDAFVERITDFVARVGS